MNAPVTPRGGPSRLKLLFWLLLVPAALIALYFVGVMNWNYSAGERAGWVQKLSKKGWICKTWEGELAMVSMPGAIPEKFYFTVWDAKVAADINAAMGRRVSLHYEEKVGLPTTCFGETRHWVNAVTIVPEVPLGPGVIVPTPGTGATPAPSGAPAPSMTPQTPVPATGAPPAAPNAGATTPAPPAPPAEPPPPAK